jgi:hypothetical protein
VKFLIFLKAYTVKKHYQNLKSRILLILSAVLLFVFQAQSQSFQIVWGMNSTLSGASSSSNFSPSDAALHGAHPHGLPTILYYSLGGGDYAYGTTYWHTTGVEKYLEFSFSINTYEYDISSVSYRIRRSAIGPKDVTLRSSLDGFSSDVSSFHLSADGTFYNINVPFSHSGLSNGITFRLYANNADSYLGVMYFDQIVISGTVTTVVLPVHVTNFEAKILEKKVHLSWETSWERGSKEFVVERSTDMINFIEIGKVAASGESEFRKQYAFLDSEPHRGASYYRLKMVDQDGSFTYSLVRDVFFADSSAELVVAPNPASPDGIRIQKHFPGVDDIILRDILGREIPVQLVYSEINYLNLIPYYRLVSGIYVLTLTQNGRKQHVKVLVR